MNQPMYVYVECGADTTSKTYPFTRKHYMHPSEVDGFRDRYHNVGVYSTVMQYLNPEFFQNEKGRWILNAKDALKWGDMYLDFDRPLESEGDFDKIRADVMVGIRYLKLILAIEEDQIQIFFSGNKGIHLTVSGHVLGLTPHVSLNQIYREIALDVQRYVQYDTLDLRVYDDKRMFRMVNSLNKKGNRHKIRITHEELEKLSLAEIRKIAEQPRLMPAPSLITSKRAKLALEKYIQKWTERATAAKEFQGKIRKLEKLPPCIKAMEEKVFRETIDERNNSGTALASFYFQQGMERDEALARMIVWGENNCSPSLPRRDMEIITNSVYNGQYRYGCGEFERLSGVCDKANCPIFNRALNVKEEEIKEESGS